MAGGLGADARLIVFSDRLPMVCTKIFFVVGAWALTAGTALQVAAWSFTDAHARKTSAKITELHVVTWLLNPVVWKDDKPDADARMLAARNYRRQRSGWAWLFLGAFFTAVATTLDLVDYLL